MFLPKINWGPLIGILIVLGSAVLFIMLVVGIYHLESHIR